MREILPFLVFAFFAALIWARGQRPRGLGLRADPPVAGPADAFARYGFFAAWAIGLAGIVAHVGPLIAITGALLLAIGALLALNAGGARDLYSERQRRYARGAPAGFTIAIAPYAALLIGAIWLVVGVAQTLR